MKKLLLLYIILLPTLLIAQQDSTKKAFKIGECRPVLIIDSIPYQEGTNVQLSDFLKGVEISIRGCGDSSQIISYVIICVANNNKEEEVSNSAKIPDYFLSEAKKAWVNPITQDAFFMAIREIKYKSKDGLTHSLPNIIRFKVVK